jgi:hypothetical protein
MIAPSAPSASAPPIVYAVWLGCHNAARLAQEWSLPIPEAARLLRAAVTAGELVRDARGRYAVPVPPRRTGRVARVRAMLRDPCRRFGQRGAA